MSLVITILQWFLGAVLILIAVILVSLYIRGAFRWRPLFHINRAIAPQDPRFSITLKSLTSSLEATGNVVDFWNTVDDIQQARLEAIARAQQRIQFETFMMTPGKRADAFADAIARKAVEGVSVQLLVDTYGARALEDSYWQRLRLVGVQVVFFNPFDWRAPANYAGRTHRKLLIIDGDRVLIGGAGISDLWDGTGENDDTEPWLDIEVALTGEVVALMAAAFQSHWQGHRLKRSVVSAIDMEAIYPDLESTQGRNTDQSSRLRPTYSKHLKSEDKSEDPKQEASSVLVTLGTKPSYRDSPIETLKQTLIACARQRVWLSSPYFLPNESTRNMLITAQQSGVDVRILTTSIRTDKKPVYYASYEVYGSLLRAGIKIFEYQPSMIHAKMLIVDDKWVNMGSANIDYRSFLHNDELDIVTDSIELFDHVEKTFEQGFSRCEQIGLRQWKRRPWLKHRVLGNGVRLVQWQL